MKINLNQKVKVKLNPTGKDIYFHKNDWLMELFLKTDGFCPDYLCREYPKEDSSGYSSFQLWELMNIYGKHISMTNSPFEDMNILYDEED
jgi:hypothetical protein